MRVTADEHLSWILARTELLGTHDVDVWNAHGLTLAEDVHARTPLPLWDNSAMDGYAIRAADIAGASAASPVVLRVTGEVLAGSPEDPNIESGCAVRIMTGAPIPSDADAVIPVELTEGDEAGTPWARDTVSAIAEVALGANIRRAGEDTRVGGTLAVAGQRLGAARLAALAAGGIERVVVRRTPRIAVIATGTELRSPGQDLARGQIPESNSLLITGLLRELGIDDVEVHRSPDDAPAFATMLSEIASRTDVVITTGGVGPGTHDIVRIALAAEPEVRAVRVAVRPGQPQCTGRLGASGERSGAFIFALPGNPVSAAVSFELFVRPALLAMQGRSDIHRLQLTARAGSDWRGVTGRLQVLPVVVGPASEDPSAPAPVPELICTPAVNPRGVSHAVGGHGAANGFALIEEDRGNVTAGDLVNVVVVDP